MKAFSCNFIVGTKSKVNTNVLKSSISGLMSMGSQAMVVNFVFNPKTFRDNVTSYIMQKSGILVYEGEMIILAKSDVFADGESINAKTLMKKVSDTIPCIADKKTKESLELELIEIKCSKL